MSTYTDDQKRGKSLLRPSLTLARDDRVADVRVRSHPNATDLAADFFLGNNIEVSRGHQHLGILDINVVLG